MAASSGYSHTQKGIIQPLLLIGVLPVIVVGWLIRAHPAFPAAVVVAVVFVALAFAFGRLTVRDEGDCLGVRFGPLPLFTRTIPYAAMTGAAKDRSTLLGGWGIHYTRKGWLWNIGGYDCVRVEMGGRSTLIGTDDPDGLAAFLNTRMEVKP